MDYRLEQLQFAIFLTSLDLSSRVRIGTIVGSAIGELSGIDPLIIPFAGDVPAEAPQLILKNDQLGWAFQLSRARLDLYWKPPEKPVANSLPDLLPRFVQAVCNLWGRFERELAARGNRLGLVATLEAETRDAAAWISSHYLRTGVGATSSEAQVHYLEKPTEEGLELNRWVRVVSRPSGPAGPEAVLLQIDVNTFPVETIVVDVNSVERFGSLAQRLINEQVVVHSRE